MLRHIREQNNAIRADISELRADVLEVKERLGFIEAQYASLSRRVDRMGGDIEVVKPAAGAGGGVVIRAAVSSVVPALELGAG